MNNVMYLFIDKYFLVSDFGKHYNIANYNIIFKNMSYIMGYTYRETGVIIPFTSVTEVKL